MNLRMDSKNGFVSIDTDGTVTLNYFQALTFRDSLDYLIEHIRPKTEMSAEEIEKKKQSWARGICEHGETFIDQCPKCNGLE